MMESPNAKHYAAELQAALESPMMRVFLWRLIVEDCRVFQGEFPLNASAYTLLAKQEIGKRLLADLKATNPALVYQAEQEYNELMRQNAAFCHQDTEEDQV